MKMFLRLFTAAVLACTQIPREAFAQAAPQLSLELKPGRRLLITWQAAAGTTRLVWTDTLGNPTPWMPLAGVQPMGGEVWQAEFPAIIPKAFFTLYPPGLPPPPPNVRLVPVGDDFQLEWDSTSDAAGYVVYVGTDPAVGPGNSLLQLSVPAANALEITGLTPGQQYYITIVAANAAGHGALAPAVSGIFGPKGVLAGTAVRQFTLATGETFDVLAEGATINAVSLGNPAAQPVSATADTSGHFRFSNLPVGDYLLGYVSEGQAGFLPTPVVVGESGAAVMPLIIPGGPQPPPPGSTLVGTLALSDGSPARNDLEDFGIHLEAQMQAVLATGTARVVRPDRTGAWAITDLTSADYPISLVVDYPGLQQLVVPVAAPPLELVRIEAVFPEILPSLKKMTLFQNGVEVRSIARGVLVTVVAEFDNPAGLPLDPRWIAEFNGVKQLATGSAPTFIFNQPPGPPGPGLADPRDGGLVLIRFIPSGITPIGPPVGWQMDPEVSIFGVGCWSGLMAQWSPYGPDVVTGAHPATVTVKHSGPLSPGTTTTISNDAGGYFEVPVDPTVVPPYLVRVDKPGYMRFLWPFEQRLPNEGTYSVTAAISNFQSQHPSGPRVFTHPLGGVITIPWGEVIDPLNQNWYGDIIVTMTTFDPTVRHPLPPGAEVRGPNLRNGILAYGGFWFEITDHVGVPLTPTAACTLTLKVPTHVNNTTMPGYHQVESTGYFERWGYAPGTDAIKTGTGAFTVTLGTKGLFLVGFDWPLVELFIEPDRTLGYPFEVRIGKSIFGVVAQSFHQVNIGRLFVPSQAVTDLNVVDLRQAPGLRYPNLASPSFYLSPMQKTTVVSKTVQPNPAIPALPAIATFATSVSLNNSVPQLTSISPSSTTALSSATHFFSRGGVNTAADANDYYARINAPATLAQWRALNGFPARFGGPLTGVSVDDYATAYYYNLGDLGFARAQTMRVKFSSIDGGIDVAYQVTNYPTLEDAICGRAAIATVCMDFSKRTDTGAQTATKYTRFYVYGSNGALVKEADLDGAGLKGVPNLCVTCHGGNWWNTSDPNRTPNLGSRFLPFDLESFTYHPKYGLQKPELGRMNKGVLLTGPTAATADLIAGWYNHPNPLANLNIFLPNYVPTTAGLSWAGNASVYTDVFKPGCRVCHNSRETTGYVQFASFANFQASNFGAYAVGNSLQMPHARRPWGIVWGSRGAVNLGQPVPNIPTIIQTLGGVGFPR